MNTEVTYDTKTAGAPGGQPPRRVVNRIWFALGYLWAALVTAFFATAYVVAHLVTRNPDIFRFWASHWGRSIMFGFGVRADVEIRAQLDCSRSYVFVANHQNALDIPVLCRVLPCSFGFVAKAELETAPFLGMALKMSPSVFVDTRDPRRSVESLRRAGQEIREGRSVIIFPEGLRTFQSEMVPFKKAAFALAAEAGVPMVPVTIVDGYRLLNEFAFAARPGAIHVVVHPPVEVTGSTRAQLAPHMDRVRSTIASAL